MNPRLVAIETKRVHLIERAARERADLAQALQSWAQPLGFIDRCLGAARYVLSRPPLVAGAMLLLALLRPRRALRWAQRIWGLWRGYRWLTQKLAG
jgi:hypothetical protein